MTKSNVARTGEIYTGLTQIRAYSNGAITFLNVTLIHTLAQSKGYAICDRSQQTKKHESQFPEWDNGTEPSIKARLTASPITQNPKWVTCGRRQIYMCQQFKNYTRAIIERERIEDELYQARYYPISHAWENHNRLICALQKANEKVNRTRGAWRKVCGLND